MDIKIPVLKISDTVYRTFISNTLMEQIAMEGIRENGSAPYAYWEFAERLSREVIPIALEEIVKKVDAMR